MPFSPHPGGRAMARFSIAYSYARYSSEPQADGDSQRGQRDKARGWGARSGVRLDEGPPHTARARGAFRGRPRKGTAPLARFLADVEADRVPRDAALLVETLDRLSRENPWQ